MIQFSFIIFLIINSETTPEFQTKLLKSLAVFFSEIRIAHQTPFAFVVSGVCADFFPRFFDGVVSGFDVAVRNRNAGAGQDVAFGCYVKPLPAGHAAEFVEIGRAHV